MCFACILPSPWRRSRGVPDEVKGNWPRPTSSRNQAPRRPRDELVAHCREHLAAYKIPRAVQFVDDVPITASGKIMRRLLKDYDDGTR